MKGGASRLIRQGLLLRRANQAALCKDVQRARVPHADGHVFAGEGTGSSEASGLDGVLSDPHLGLAASFTGGWPFSFKGFCLHQKPVRLVLSLAISMQFHLSPHHAHDLVREGHSLFRMSLEPLV